MSYLDRVFRETEADNRRAILDALPFGDGEFDVVHSNQVIDRRHAAFVIAVLRRV
jgi:hypothetical protein